MAKDTEKLIRQLSLISFLMAQGRPVSALEIKREAMRMGMITLRRVGLLNAMRGRTSLEEILRVTLED